MLLYMTLHECVHLYTSIRISTYNISIRHSIYLRANAPSGRPRGLFFCLFFFLLLLLLSLSLSLLPSSVFFVGFAQHRIFYHLPDQEVSRASTSQPRCLLGPADGWSQLRLLTHTTQPGAGSSESTPDAYVFFDMAL